MAVLKLAEVDPPVNRAVLPSGREVDIYPADAIAIEMALELEKDTTVEGLRVLVSRLLREATPDEIGALTPAMMAAVCTHATSSVARTREQLGES